MSARKKRRLLNEEEEAAALAEFSAAETERQATPRRSLTALAPPTPTLPPIQNSTAKSGLAKTKDLAASTVTPKRLSKDGETPRKAAAETSSSSLLRSTLRSGPSSFPTTPKLNSISSIKAQKEHRPSPLRPPPLAPQLAQAKKPPDRPHTASLSSRAPFLTTFETRAASLPFAKEADDLKPAKLELSFAQKPEEDVLTGARGITEYLPSVEKNARKANDGMEELSSPRKRKGGGYLANGLAQQAVEVLNRARTDHALWQHALARRIGSSTAADVPALLASAQPDLRLKVLHILSGPQNATRLVAQCAILPEGVVPSSQLAEMQEALDVGTVVFSLALQSSANGLPPPRARKRTESSGPVLIPLHSPLDLSMLAQEVEVWVFEPWTAITVEKGDSLASQASQESSSAQKALLCTRFAALKA